jgi:hypothetical protein
MWVCGAVALVAPAICLALVPAGVSPTKRRLKLGAFFLLLAAAPMVGSLLYVILGSVFAKTSEVGVVAPWLLLVAYLRFGAWSIQAAIAAGIAYFLLGRWFGPRTRVLASGMLAGAVLTFGFFAGSMPKYGLEEKPRRLEAYSPSDSEKSAAADYLRQEPRLVKLISPPVNVRVIEAAKSEPTIHYVLEASPVYQRS